MGQAKIMEKMKIPPNLEATPANRYGYEFETTGDQNTDGRMQMRKDKCTMIRIPEQDDVVEMVFLWISEFCTAKMTERNFCVSVRFNLIFELTELRQ